LRLVLDAGALVAIDKGDRQLAAMLRVAHEAGGAVVTSAGVVAQVWRDGARQANLARVLRGVEVVALDAPSARRIGGLLARVGSSDVVDGHVAVLCRADDRLLTSDPADLTRLLGARACDAVVVQV
jgi:hypothetical protein